MNRPRPIRTFLEIEASSGILLLSATVAALVWANSPWQDTYRHLWSTTVGFDAGGVHLRHDLVGWVNDALMVLFFFVVGLEIKREWVSGELRDRRAAALPALAALGGMVVPALLFLAITAGTEAGHGWGVPMATDIAFALGVVALLGRRVPTPLRVFLLTLAIVDDIGAIAVIAVAYSDKLALGWLAVAVAVVIAVMALRRIAVRAHVVFLASGVALWLCVLQSGVHPTIAGVAMGLLTPVEPLGRRLEESLHPWTSNLVIPMFALANAGIVISGQVLPGGRLLVGVVVGLVVGKTIGISAASWLAIKLGVAELPSGVRWAQLVGVAMLAGIGFTVALFVTGLAFRSPVVAAEAKLGVLAGSLVAAGFGSAVLVLSARGASERSLRD